MRIHWILLGWIACQPLLWAQGPAQRHATEWAITSGGAADVPGGAQGGEFWAVQLRWGKVLTAPHGPGPLRGTLEYAFEIVPAIVLRQTCAVWTFASLSDFLAGTSKTGIATRGCRASDGAVLGSSGVRFVSKPETLFGGGINPFFWQYNFTSHPRVIPYLQVGGGMLWTTRDFPVGTSSFNFTPQAGIGAYWFAWPQRAVSFGARYHHISNAGLSKPNPGHNALYFYAGLSWWR